MSKFGFIGCGNMGGTLAKAAAKSVGAIDIADTNAEKLKEISAETKAEVKQNTQIAAECTFLFLGVKPQALGSVLAGIAGTLKNRADHFVIVSMAAGISIDSVTKLAGGEYPVIRIMPNTPAAVGKGLILYCKNDLVSDDDITQFLAAMRYAGETDAIAEPLIDAASAVSGCGPAFVYLFIEALADGAVKCGLPRDKAMKYAAQTVLGAGQTVLTTGVHPGALKDAVCSPAGSTIAGVSVLEKNAFRGTVSSAVVSAFERTKELGK